jgi:hypothetical protein
VLVRATDTAYAVTVAGAVVVTDESASGASVGVNTVIRDTEAVIGNRLGDHATDARSPFTSGGGVVVNAANHGFVGTFAVTGAKAGAKQGPAQPAQPAAPASPVPTSSGGSGDTQGQAATTAGTASLTSWEGIVQTLLEQSGGGSGSEPPTSGKAPSQASGQAKTNAAESKDASAKSGSIAVNVVSDNARAYVRNAGVMNTGALTVRAENDTTVVALAGSVALAKAEASKAASALSGALAVTYVTGSTEAFVDGATSLTARGLSITADRGGWIISISAAIAAASGQKGTAGTGSVGVVWAEYTTSARLANIAGATAITGRTLVEATDATNIVMVGGGLSFGGKGGYGVGLAFGNIKNTTTATIESVANLTHTGAVDVVATSAARIINVTASLGVATGGGGQQGPGAAGSVSVNLVRNTVRAGMTGVTTTTSSSGAITVSADDHAAIYGIVGGIAYGKSGGYGLAIGINVIANTVAATLESSTLGTAGALKVEADERAKIVGLAIGGAVSSGQGSAIAGSVGVNAISNSVTAHIRGTTATRVTGVTVKALDASTMIAVAGSLGVSKSGTGVGVAIGWNRVSNSVAAFVEGSTLSATGGGVNVQATSTSLLVNVGAAGAGSSKGTGGAGALVINSIANSVDAHIGALSTVSATGDINVTASEAASMIVVSLAIAGSGGGSGVGALLAYNYVGQSNSVADPNLISKLDAAGPEGVQTVNVAGSDTATASNVKAYIDSSTVTAGGKLSVLAGFDDPTKQGSESPTLGTTTTMPASSVTVTGDTIALPSAHGWTTGSRVVYRSGSGTAIGGLSDATSYFVIVVNPTTVKLATTLESAVANRAIPLSSTGSGSGHSLGLLDLSRQTAFDAATTTVDVDGSNRLVFPKEHGFADGEQVVYTANGGRVIAGLESGKRYFVKLVDAKTIQLATTSGGTAIDLAATGLDEFGTGSSGESFTPVSGTWTTFTPSSAVTTTRSRADQLTYASPHGLADGSAVIYRANGAPIAGLVDGETYYAIVIDLRRHRFDPHP